MSMAASRSTAPARRSWPRFRPSSASTFCTAATRNRRAGRGTRNYVLAFVIDLTVVEAITMTILQTTAAALFALSLAAPAFAADGVPRLNVRPTCHPIDASDKTIRIDTERCLKTENDVREQLVRQWA